MILIIFIGGIFVSQILGRVLPSNKLGKITVLFIGSVVLLILLGVDRTSYFYLFFYYSSNNFNVYFIICIYLQSNGIYKEKEK